MLSFISSAKDIVQEWMSEQPPPGRSTRFKKDDLNIIDFTQATVDQVRSWINQTQDYVRSSLINNHYAYKDTETKGTTFYKNKSERNSLKERKDEGTYWYNRMDFLRKSMSSRKGSENVTDEAEILAEEQTGVREYLFDGQTESEKTAWADMQAGSSEGDTVPLLAVHVHHIKED